jgi:hypothetical protein
MGGLDHSPHGDKQGLCKTAHIWPQTAARIDNALRKLALPELVLMFMGNYDRTLKNTFIL